jgi:hypothetical protein
MKSEVLHFGLDEFACTRANSDWLFSGSGVVGLGSAFGGHLV